MIAGVAVQWGNLADRNRETGERVSVGELYSFARDELRLDYIFWGTQEPFYSRDILPYLRSLVSATAQPVGSLIRSPAFFAVQVRDVEGATAWYSDVFDMGVVKSLDAEDGRYSIRILSGGLLTVELIHETRAEESPARSRGLFKAGIYVEDIDAFHEKLLARGVDADERIFADSALGVRSFVFQDLEGNRLQAFEEAGGTP
jgi:catechol 2,3-dioxygenase-like lactoylglutathione lyase family enzyme